MITIGIVGGVASGKSTISRRLAELGAHVLDADRMGHAVLDEPEVVQAARDRWGDAVVDADGRLVRSAIASRVFGDGPGPARELEFWESQTHPRITERVDKELKRLANNPVTSSLTPMSPVTPLGSTQKVPSGAVLQTVVVLDAALLLKAQWERFCDHVIFVQSTHESRLARAKKRGWTAEQFAAREAAQLPIEEKKKKATHVIDNTGPLDQTYAQVQNFWASLFSESS